MLLLSLSNEFLFCLLKVHPCAGCELTEELKEKIAMGVTACYGTKAFV